MPSSRDDADDDNAAGVDGVSYEDDELGSDEEAEGLDLDNMTYEVRYRFSFWQPVGSLPSYLVKLSCQTCWKFGQHGPRNLTCNPQAGKYKPGVQVACLERDC